MTTKYNIDDSVNIPFKVLSIDIRQKTEKKQDGTIEKKDVVFYKVQAKTQRGTVVLELEEKELV